MRRGFTLVEVLIVVGIVALLLAVLLPALGAARGKARDVDCLANLKQHSTAVAAYHLANGGAYPISYAYDGPDLVTAWDFSPSPTGGDARPGTLWSGIGLANAGDVPQCPTFPVPDENAPGYDEDRPLVGYNFNTSHLGGFRVFYGNAWVAPARAASVARPDRVAVFGDAQGIGGANAFMFAPLPNDRVGSYSGRPAATQGFRHDDATQTAYADGHAGRQVERFAGPAGIAANVAEGTGFLSDDNAAYGE